MSSKEKPGWRFDPVTDADRAAEKALRKALATAFPDHAILGEEFGSEGSGRFRWVLDPVDGTRPFLCGLPLWATLIGFEVDGRAVMGMMSQPFTGERFWAGPDGAWTARAGRRERLRTRDVGDLSQAVLHTTSPEGYGPLSEKLKRLMAKVRMTRFGGEAYATAMLASGYIDLCLEPALQPYDIVALIPIIEAAGGLVTRLDGERAERGGPVLAAATANLHEQAMAVLCRE
ncbi:inositol monophosphatase family protein [Aurantiacibacter flavus]|uniref:inositol monophosphatase family protein n=1 Tax=Aurantiacibacter flavus TaxID=3145232 RepID=UPI00321789FD